MRAEVSCIDLLARGLFLEDRCADDSSRLCHEGVSLSCFKLISGGGVHRRLIGVVVVRVNCV